MKNEKIQKLDCGCIIDAFGRQFCEYHLQERRRQMDRDRERALERMNIAVERERIAQRTLENPNANKEDKKKAFKLLKEHDALGE